MSQFTDNDKAVIRQVSEEACRDRFACADNCRKLAREVVDDAMQVKEGKCAVHSTLLDNVRRDFAALQRKYEQFEQESKVTATSIHTINKRQEDALAKFDNVKNLVIAGATFIAALLKYLGVW